MRRFIRAATAAALVGSLGLLPLSACSSTSGTNLPDTSEPAESASVEQEPDNGDLYKNFALDPDDIQIEVHTFGEQILYSVDDSNVDALSVIVVFLDAYGDYLGDYQCLWDTKIPGGTGVANISGLDEVRDAEAYVYSYLLSNGEVWGDRKAIENGDVDDVLAYGKAIPVSVI